jgi:hypothetical protein
MRAVRDRYGFVFWLRWILLFCGSLIAAAAGWTWAFKAVFGVIRGPELTLTWIVAVFGSWLLLVIPFMRKKEQIWKRLNEDQERAVDAWFAGMGLFIATLAATAVGWSVVFRARLAADGMDGAWAKAVFGTWLAALFPFLIAMYRQADRIFTRAVARQTYSPTYRKAWVDRGRRILAPQLAEKLKKTPATLPNGHVVTAVLRDGRRIPHVFVMRANEILGVYDRHELDFAGSDVIDVEPTPANELPPYEEPRWLRLDG